MNDHEFIAQKQQKKGSYFWEKAAYFWKIGSKSIPKSSLLM